VSLRPYSLTIDAHDPQRLAEFWCRALGYDITLNNEDEVAIEKPGDESVLPLLFIRVPDEKVVKNRVHLDLAPDDQGAEVTRLKALGAREVDIGQRDVSWVVMADPEGNEFCVLTAR
jgi:hypothetical protein